MFAWLALLLVLLVLTLSVWQRIQYFRETIDDQNVKVSPLSLAIQELISISGSIYLSLITLVSFLKLDIPKTIIIFEFSIDPLALSSISLAIIQPVFVNLYHAVKKRLSV